MKQIPLTKNMFALVDDDIYEWASHFKWFAKKNGNYYFAVRRIYNSSKNSTLIQLHQCIMGSPINNFKVMFIDGNRLNIQRSNLKIIVCDSKNSQFCPNGHDKDLLGREKSGQCLECSRISSRNWKRRNKEHYHVYQKERYGTACKTARSKFKLFKSNAKRKGININLTFEQYFPFTLLPCEYCGKTIDTTGSGLDRILNDYSIGYVIGNIVPCCSYCNSMKMDKLTYEEMKLIWKLRKEENKIKESK